MTDHINSLSGLRVGSVIFGLAPVSEQPPVGGVTETTRTGWHTKGQAAAGQRSTPLFSWVASLFGRASRTGRRQPLPDVERYAARLHPRVERAYRTGSTR